jgi:hypothetical protein
MQSISTIASTTRRTLVTINGIIDEYEDRPLKLSAGLLSSMNRTLIKCLGFVDAVTQMEDMSDDPYADVVTEANDPYRKAIADLKAEVWPTRPKSDTYPPDDVPMDEGAEAEPVLTSFLLLEATLNTWNRMKSLVEEINKFLEENPRQATAHLLDSAVTFAANSIKFQKAAEYVSAEKAKAREIEQGGGFTAEEREVQAQWDEISGDLEALAAMFATPDGPYTGPDNSGTNIKNNRQRTSLNNRQRTSLNNRRSLNDLETEEDYRYGMNPVRKPF